MYAIIRKNTFSPDKLTRAAGALAEFRELHAAQPGYAGSIEIDMAPAEHIVVHLWETEQDASAGLVVLVPHVRRLLEPLMAGPSQVIGAGQAATTDLARGVGSTSGHQGRCPASAASRSPTSPLGGTLLEGRSRVQDPPAASSAQHNALAILAATAMSCRRPMASGRWLRTCAAR
jgi:hypothetical protein